MKLRWKVARATFSFAVVLAGVATTWSDETVHFLPAEPTVPWGCQECMQCLELWDGYCYEKMAWKAYRQPIRKSCDGNCLSCARLRANSHSCECSGAGNCTDASCAPDVSTPLERPVSLTPSETRPMIMEQSPANELSDPAPIDDAAPMDDPAPTEDHGPADPPGIEVRADEESSTQNVSVIKGDDSPTNAKPAAPLPPEPIDFEINDVELPVNPPPTAERPAVKPRPRPAPSSRRVQPTRPPVQPRSAPVRQVPPIPEEPVSERPIPADSLKMFPPEPSEDGQEEFAEPMRRSSNRLIKSLRMASHRSSK